jgi:transposase InsO family protein
VAAGNKSLLLIANAGGFQISVFTSLKEARQTIEEWRINYNTKRPHSSLGYVPPAVWAKQHSDNAKALYL